MRGPEFLGSTGASFVDAKTSRTVAAAAADSATGKIEAWKKAAIREADAERPVFDKPMDLVVVAQEALRPSIEALIPANDPPALKVLPATTTAKTKKTRTP